MRVLAIRGENLASLGQPFNIDFEAEPLAGTGLFAITGETGSGKSTILDALCLALYGAYPRFAEQHQDALPDPSGVRPAIADGGTILRRGVGNGHAEVEFIGQDGLRYRARWEARRAYGRPNGTVQGAKRILHQVDGETLTPIADTKTSVQKTVDTQTGLTFDQFCRTVLLPQGEFDAFLLAEKSERGALLEKITGTEIYGRISTIIFSGTRKLRDEAAALEIRLTNLGLLRTEERESIEQAIAALKLEVETKTGEQQALQARITHLQNLTQAQQRFSGAEQALADARNNAELAGPNRNRLASLQSAEPLRPLRISFIASTDRQPGAEEKSSQAKEALEQLTREASDARGELALSRATNVAAEQTFKDYGPVWDDAARLDTDRSKAQAEATSACNTADSSREALDDIDADLGTLEEQINSAAAELQSASTALEEQSRLFPIADQLSQIEALLGRYTNQTAEIVKFRKLKTEADKTAAGLNDSLTALGIQIDTETDSQQQTTENAQALEQQLQGSEESKWQTDETDITALHRQARDLKDLTGRYQTSTVDVQNAMVEFRRATSSKNDAATRIVSAENSIREQTTRRADIQSNTELAEQSLEQRSAHLRSLLIDGQHCPVCGATEHPYTAPGAEDSLTALADSLRQERNSLDEQLAAFNVDLLRATADSTSATGKLGNAERNQTQAKSEIQNITEEFVALRSAMEPSCTRIDLLGSLPESLSEDTSAMSAVDHLISGIEEQRTIVNGSLSAIKELRRQLDAAYKSSREAQERLNSANQQRQLEQSSLHQAELKATSASVGITQATAQVAEIEGELSSFLTAADITLEFLQEHAAIVIVTLRGHAQTVLSLRVTKESLASQHEELVERQKQKAGARQNLAERSREADEKLDQRNKTLRELTDARSLLLNGEDTHQHRTRINNERTQAQSALQSSQDKEREFAQKLATATELERSTSAALTSLLAEINQARNAYHDGCTSLGIDVARTDELLATSATDVNALKTLLDTIDRAVRDAETTLNDRRSALDALSAGEDEIADHETLTQGLAQITNELNQANQDIGNKQGRITSDDALRVTAADIRREADEMAAELAIWQQVEDAIGSANGDRFRTFAQSFTLDQLVQLANDHLNSFSKRYQLSRSQEADLSLHVVDNEMGEEHRAIRSLSGGERFLVSLSLALSLAGLEGNEFSVDTLFIDEGFGALDADTLDIAITALETLHGQGRKVGVITHVAAMIESIPVQVKVVKLGGGSSIVRLESVASII
jgi:DNA repair protein SbcC/Rad50